MITSGERERGRDKIGWGIKRYKLPYKIDKLQGYIVQHKKYSQYLIITLNGV